MRNSTNIFVFFLVLTLGTAVALAAPAAEVERDERAVVVGDRAAPAPPPPANEIDLRRAMAPASKQARLSVVAVVRKGEQVALGVVASDDGYVVTKASEIGASPDEPVNLRLAGGAIRRARLVGVAGEHDLALLKIDGGKFSPAQWASGDDVPPGKWVASVGMSELPLAVGIVSVGRRTIPADAIMGVFLADIDDESTGGALIVRVDPQGNAAKAGVRGGDIITAVNERTIGKREDVLTEISRHRPGDVVVLTMLRNDERVTSRVTLAKRPQPSTRSVRQNTMGSRLSDRRSGFTAVLQHDAVNLQPRDCGSPLVTLAGEIVGINIACAGRTETFAVPASVVVKVIAELRQAEADRAEADRPDASVLSDEQPATEKPDAPLPEPSSPGAEKTPTTQPT
ncbi:MAG TPA: PDZ domain-containing protein [Tepidisphaeraceae bacterium]|nr:PDZ domain-containing protein [Tepidisphaeraceae bacterium]